MAKVRVKEEELPTGVLGKVAGLGVRVSTPAMAVPVRAAVAGPTFRVADLVPAEVGLNMITRLQVEPAAKAEPHMFAMVNIAASAPERVGVGKETLAEPGLVS